MKTSIIKLGYFCNNNCLFCHEHYRTPVFFDTQLLKRHINKSKLASAKKIILSGGEPTLSKDLTLLLDYIKYKKLKSSIITNGRLLSYYDYVVKLKKAGLDSAYVSLHGSNKKIHDRLTNVNNSFNQTIQGIVNLKRNKIEVCVRTVVTKVNVHDLKNIIALCNNYGIRKLEFSLFEPIGYNINNKKKLLLPLNLITAKVKEAIIFSKKFKNLAISTEGFPKCLFLGVKSFDILEKNIVYKFISTDINSEKILRTNSKVKLEKCINCGYSSRCRGVYDGYEF